MKNEFEVIERKMFIELKNNFDKYIDEKEDRLPKNFFTRKFSKDDHPKFDDNDLYEEYNVLFNDEKIRIKNSITDNQFNLNEKDFEKYITINYKRLKELKDPEAINIMFKFFKDEIQNNLNIRNKFYTEYILKGLFQLGFVRPMELYFENTFQNILSKAGYLPTAIDIFISNISKFTVDINHRDPSTDNWANCDDKIMAGDYSDFSFLFNGYEDIYTHKTYLNDLYKNFKDYILNYINSGNSLNSIFSFLNNLLITLDELRRSYKSEIMIPDDIYSERLSINNKNLIINVGLFLPQFKNVPRYYLTDYNRFLNTQRDITDNAYLFIKNQFDLVKEMPANNTISVNTEVPKIPDSTPEKTNLKIKTNLSVDELSYFFKCLHDEKVLEINDGEKEQLFRSISNYFNTKRKKDDNI